MEKKYPTLRRPKRKLCYITDKKSPPKQLGEALTLEEAVDKMFDDIESCAPLHSSSLLLQSCDTDTNPSQTQISPVSEQKCPTEKLPRNQMGHKEVVLHATTEAPSPKLDIDLDIPFKADGPIKTSSPIEHNLSVHGVHKLDNEKDRDVLPILSNCGHEIVEDPNKDLLPAQNALCSGDAQENDDGDELESPPSRVTITKMPSHKVKGGVLCKQENVEPLAPAVSLQPKTLPSEKKKGKDMTAFLEKLKLAVQPQSTCYKKSPAKVSPPLPAPEPEDDFCILEDDVPFWISIPSKSATNRRQNLSKTTSTDKESSTNKETKDSPRKSPQEQLELVKGNVKPENQKKRKEKPQEAMEPVNDEDVLPSPQDPPASDLVGWQKQKKKKPQLKVKSGEIDMVQDQHDEIPSMEEGKEKSSIKTKAHKSSARKNLKKGKEIVTANTLKVTRKKQQDSDVVKDVPLVDAVKELSPAPGHAEDLASFTDKKVAMVTSEADGKTTANKQPTGSGGSSPEDAEDLGKRKRKQTGQWWQSCPQSTEEKESWQPSPKKSKQHGKKSKAAVLSPTKAKKGKVSKKKTNQEPPVQLSCEHTGKEKKSKQIKKRNTRRNTMDKMKAAEEILNTYEAEQEQQEVLNQDLDQQESSPLVFTQRGHSVDSGGQIFQKVYHHNMNLVSSESPRQPKQQLMKPESGKRRRRTPGNWWTVNNMGDDLESDSSQPQLLPPTEPKPQQERKKPSKLRKPAGLGVPKNGNMVIPIKPPGGALTTSLKPLPTPKTVKPSLATFNDIFTSRTVTPIVASSRDAHQSNRCHITSHPAEDVSATDATCSRAAKDALIGDAEGCRGTQISQKIPQDKYSQSENSRSEVLRSGPSSMIQLEEYEDHDDMIMPSSRVQTMLAISDISAPPLKPLSLHPKDKAALTEWFQSLWSPSANDTDGAAVTPDQFDWYSYKDRAFGIQADLNSGSICSGKILLGSHMKKPLWVDHTATTVFNLLTSSVSVSINGSVSRHWPGQTFIVECGSAYSIHNNNAQPAVLFFTRILTESSD